MTLLRRFTSSNGQCAPQAPDATGIVSDSVSDPKQTDAIATGTVSSSSFAREQASGSHDSFHVMSTASCTQDGDFELAIGTP